jgi:dephospho-CoA kinase
VARFGAGVLDATGAVDRAALGAIVFADQEARRQLEHITHPRINTLMQRRILEAMQGPARLVVAEIPLLFENGREAAFDGTLLVYAPPSTQLRRLRERDRLDDASAQRRLAAQLSIDAKRTRATWVIDNSGSRESTVLQVDDWWHAVVGDG